MEFKFEVIHKSKKSRARVGRIYTPHGVIDTPSFVAVGTNGTLKALDSKAVDELGLQLMFCNTYHLLLQPGPGVVKNAGGLHSFMNRTQPIITDSGGFQVFSLAYGGVYSELKSKGKKKHDGTVLKINEEGALFRSYRNGDKILLTPESSIQAQKDFGADIIVAFDELPPYHISSEKLKASLERTHRWEKRSLDAHVANKNGQALYAVVHGGLDRNLRKKSCEYLSSLPFDGYAIGGSVGKDRQEMLGLVTDVMPWLPDDKPNHLLGIGDLPSIAGAIPHGVDTFDSSHPTKCARHGLLFTKTGTVRIAQGGNANLLQPIEDDCPCPTCRHYTVSYLHHLFKAKETTWAILATIHNVAFMVQLMEGYREQILLDLV
ncbi:tRNA-guanosine(34) transglycosylase [Candidatus Dependentiae bacterium]|nr:tRNA-guanosine(34) transglycosylase [Candidatus Dependentiae bacterium]